MQMRRLKWSTFCLRLINCGLREFPQRLFFIVDEKSEKCFQHPEFEVIRHYPNAKANTIVGSGNETFTPYLFRYIRNFWIIQMIQDIPDALPTSGHTFIRVNDNPECLPT